MNDLTTLNILVIYKYFSSYEKLIICILSATSLHSFSEENIISIEFPQPAPSYLRIKLDKTALFDVGGVENLDKAHFIFSSDPVTTIIFHEKENDNYTAMFKVQSNIKNNINPYVARSIIDNVIAKDIIVLWFDWLSMTRNREGEDDYDTTFYAACIKTGKSREGIITYDSSVTTFSSKMANLIKKFNIYISYMSYAENTEIKIPIDRSELPMIIEKLKIELSQEILNLQTKFNAITVSGK